MNDEELIPDVLELSQTTPYRYHEVLSLCKLYTNTYGVDFRDIINRYKQAGELSKAYDFLRGSMIAWEINEMISESNPIDFEKWTYRSDTNNRKKEKLPKKFRNGWK